MTSFTNKPADAAQQSDNEHQLEGLLIGFECEVEQRPTDLKFTRRIFIPGPDPLYERDQVDVPFGRSSETGPWRQADTTNLYFPDRHLSAEHGVFYISEDYTLHYEHLSSRSNCFYNGEPIQRKFDVSVEAGNVISGGKTKLTVESIERTLFSKVNCQSASDPQDLPANKETTVREDAREPTENGSFTQIQDMRDSSDSDSADEISVFSPRIKVLELADEIHSEPDDSDESNESENENENERNCNIFPVVRVDNTIHFVGLDDSVESVSNSDDSQSSASGSDVDDSSHEHHHHSKQVCFDCIAKPIGHSDSDSADDYVLSDREDIHIGFSPDLDDLDDQGTTESVDLREMVYTDITNFSERRGKHLKRPFEHIALDQDVADSSDEDEDEEEEDSESDQHEPVYVVSSENEAKRVKPSNYDTNNHSNSDTEDKVGTGDESPVERRRPLITGRDLGVAAITFVATMASLAALGSNM